MNNQMSVKYDRVSDILYIDACEPYAEQESDQIATGVIARMNPRTGEVENLEVLHFQSRFESGDRFRIPVSLDMRTVRSA